MLVWNWLGRKTEGERNIDQGLVSAYQERFGALEKLRADVLMRRLTS
jgi:hypothetical protein